MALVLSRSLDECYADSAWNGQCHRTCNGTTHTKKWNIDKLLGPLTRALPFKQVECWRHQSGLLMETAPQTLSMMFTSPLTLACSRYSLAAAAYTSWFIYLVISMTPASLPSNCRLFPLRPLAFASCAARSSLWGPSPWSRLRFPLCLHSPQIIFLLRHIIPSKSICGS